MFAGYFDANLALCLDESPSRMLLFPAPIRDVGGVESWGRMSVLRSFGALSCSVQALVLDHAALLPIGQVGQGPVRCMGWKVVSIHVWRMAVRGAQYLVSRVRKALHHLGMAAEILSLDDPAAVQLYLELRRQRRRKNKKLRRAFRRATASNSGCAKHVDAAC